MPFTHWIQRHDYESQDHGAIDAEAAAALFGAHDWAAEYQPYSEASIAGDDCCPPGIGFVGEGGMLHVFKAVDEGWSLMVTWPSAGKLFGVFPKPGRQASHDEVDAPQALRAIALFFAGDERVLDLDSLS